MAKASIRESSRAFRPSSSLVQLRRAARTESQLRWHIAHGWWPFPASWNALAFNACSSRALRRIRALPSSTGRNGTICRKRHAFSHIWHLASLQMRKKFRPTPACQPEIVLPHLGTLGVLASWATSLAPRFDRTLRRGTVSRVGIQLVFGRKCSGCPESRLDSGLRSAWPE
jgi:hypothetical protein